MWKGPTWQEGTWDIPGAEEVGHSWGTEKDGV